MVYAYWPCTFTALSMFVSWNVWLYMQDSLYIFMEVAKTYQSYYYIHSGISDLSDHIHLNTLQLDHSRWVFRQCYATAATVGLEYVCTHMHHIDWMTDSYSTVHACALWCMLIYIDTLRDCANTHVVSILCSLQPFIYVIILELSSGLGNWSDSPCNIDQLATAAANNHSHIHLRYICTYNSKCVL